MFRMVVLTVGDRAFPVAAARAWTNLPPNVTSAPSHFFYFQKETQNQTFFSPFFALTVYMHAYNFACIISHASHLCLFAF